MTRPGIESMSPGPFANILPTRPYIYIYTHTLPLAKNYGIYILRWRPFVFLAVNRLTTNKMQNIFSLIAEQLTVLLLVPCFLSIINAQPIFEASENCLLTLDWFAYLGFFRMQITRSSNDFVLNNKLFHHISLCIAWEKYTINSNILI